MATRRRSGADLDDLKARLGFSESRPGEDAAADGGESSADDATSEAASGSADVSDDAAPAPAAPAAAPAVAAPAASVSAPAPAAAPAAAAPPAARPAPKPAPARPATSGEDYASLVAPTQPAVEKLDANAFDPELKVPGRSASLGIAIVGVVALLFGLIVGNVFAGSNLARKQHNATVVAATSLLGSIEPVAAELRSLNEALLSIPADTEFSESFQTTLAAAYDDGPPVFDLSLLAQARALVAADADLNRMLVEYAMNTLFLRRLVQTHREATTADAEQIQRELAGTESRLSYGIAFSFEDHVARYNLHLQDAAANPFSASQGERVAFEQLTIRSEGSGEAAIEVYDVQNTVGESYPVPIYNLITVPREQLLPALTTETPVGRYTARARQIKAALEAIVTAQADITTRLEELAARGQVFTL